MDPPVPNFMLPRVAFPPLQVGTVGAVDCGQWRVVIAVMMTERVTSQIVFVFHVRQRLVFRSLQKIPVEPVNQSTGQRISLSSRDRSYLNIGTGQSGMLNPLVSPQSIIELLD